MSWLCEQAGGYSVLQGLRQSRLSEVPVLAITADAMEGEGKDVLASGGRDLLQKPYSVADLQGKLKKWLKSKKEEGEEP